MRRLKLENPDYIIRDCYYGMLKRCYSKKRADYCIYGGRGIQVCEEWRASFAAFRDWAVANGWKQGLQIDRIDCDGDYEPDNCRFVTSQTNNRNRRNNKLDESKVRQIREMLKDGKSCRSISKEFGVHDSLIGRIKHNKQWIMETLSN